MRSISAPTLRRSLVAAAVAGIIGVIGLGALAPAAGAQTSPSIAMPTGQEVSTAKVNAVVTTDAPGGATGHTIPTYVTVTFAGTGAPAPGPYDVFANGIDTSGFRTVAFPCEQYNKIQQGAPPNVYQCQVILDSGGLWTITAGVHLPNFDPRVTIGAQVGSGSKQITFNASTLAGLKRNEYIYGNIKGHARDVIVLILHTISSLGWMLCVAALTTLAVPRFRRALSGRYIHAMESRFADLQRAGLIGAVLTTGTGIYLILKQTAYRTPFSLSRWRLEQHLPYAKPYFISLVVKLIGYAAMEVATFVVLMEARRVVGLARPDDGYEVGDEFSPRASDDDGYEYDDPEYDEDDEYREQPAPAGADSHYGAWDDDAPSGGGTATLTRRRRLSRQGRAERTVSRNLLQAALVTQVVGAVVVFSCVVLLKYYHELVEGARAVVNHL